MMKHEIRITKLETNHNNQNTNDQNIQSPLLSQVWEKMEWEMLMEKIVEDGREGIIVR